MLCSIDYDSSSSRKVTASALGESTCVTLLILLMLWKLSIHRRSQRIEYTSIGDSKGPEIRSFGLANQPRVQLPFERTRHGFLRKLLGI